VIGKPGHRGPKGLTGPLQKDAMFDTIMTHFDDVYRQLETQLTRISQMQAQIDLLAAKANKTKS